MIEIQFVELNKMRPFDKESAIVEIRAIQHVKFLSRSSKPATFLSSPMFVVEEAKALYKWLPSFKN